MAGEAQDGILPLMKLKEMLALCATEPLGCAFGLTKDKKDCLLMVDKRGKPKRVATLMKTAGKALLDVQTVRFGRVTVDAANDPGTLRFTVNRSEAGGTIVTLNKLAKRAGYSAIVINADASLESESEEQGVPPAPPPPPASPKVDPAALKARLGELVKQMMARLPNDPDNQEKLTKLAKTANIQLATNNFTTAITLMDGLEKMLQAPLPPGNEEMDKVRKARQGLAAALAAAGSTSATLAAKIAGEDKALEAAIKAGDTAVARERLFELVVLSKQGGAGNQGNQAGGDKSGVRLAEALMTWNRARSYVGQQVTALQREIVAQTEDEDDADEIASNVGMLDRLMDVLDDSLGDKLSEIRAAADPAQKAALSKQAKSIVAGFQQRVAADRLMNIIDDNGFIPMDIKPTVTTALADVMASL